MKKVILLVVLLAGSFTYGQQPWSGIVPAAHAADWANTGVQGGIPNVTTVAATFDASNPSDPCYNLTDCSTAFNNAVTAANTAWKTDGIKRVITFAKGDYVIGTTNYYKLQSGVTLRGAGTKSSNQTRFLFRGSTGFYPITLGTDSHGLSAFGMMQNHNYGPVSVDATGTTTLGTACNNGSGPSLAQGSNCVHVNHSDFFDIDNIPTHNANNPLGSKQGWAVFDMIDDGGGYINGGAINNYTGGMARVTSMGDSGSCVWCDAGAQRYWYMMNGATAYAYTPSSGQAGWNASVAGVNQTLNKLLTWGGYILQVTQCSGTCTSGSTMIIPSTPNTTPVTIGSKTYDNNGPNQVYLIAMDTLAHFPGTSTPYPASPTVTSLGTYYSYNGYVWEVFGCWGTCTLSGTAPFGLSAPQLPTQFIDNPGANQVVWTAVDVPTRSEGQIVRITGIDSVNNVITFSPPLYVAYDTTRFPHATPIGMARWVGLENIEFYYDKENGATGNYNMGMTYCENCWTHRVKSNYTTYIHYGMDGGLHDTLDQSYFSNAYWHRSSTTGDMCVGIRQKTTYSRVESNIMDRLHITVMVEWGVVGNAITYNYATGFFHNSNGVAEFGLAFHGAHSEFNLFEGNADIHMGADSIWGSNSDNVFFRNYAPGTTKVCIPTDTNLSTGTTPRAGVLGYPPVTCDAGPPSLPGSPFTNAFSLPWPPTTNGYNSWYGFQASQGMSVENLGTYTFLGGNVVGSPLQRNLFGYGGNASTQTLGPPIAYADKLWAVCNPSDPSIDPAHCGTNSAGYELAHAYRIGYNGSTTDVGGTAWDSLNPWNTIVVYQDYDNMYDAAHPSTSGTNGIWSQNPPGGSPALPPSFYLASQPAWWHGTNYPAIGYGVSGGGTTGLNDAATFRGYLSGSCYNPAMCLYFAQGGAEGGPNSPIDYDAAWYDGGAVTQYALNVTSVNGTVTSTPAGISCKNGVGTCVFSFDSGTVVSLAVSNIDVNYSVNNWTGANSACTNQITCSVTMTGIKNVTVNYTFTATPPSLTITSDTTYCNAVQGCAPTFTITSANFTTAGGNQPTLTLVDFFGNVVKDSTTGLPVSCTGGSTTDFCFQKQGSINGTFVVHWAPTVYDYGLFQESLTAIGTTGSTRLTAPATPVKMLHPSIIAN